jgi:hypothetical protein
MELLNFHGKVGLYGGGRWASGLARVLSKLLPPDADLVWVTKHHSQQAIAWQQECDGGPKIHVVQDFPLPAGQLDAAIVATAAPRHFGLLTECIEANIPVLCEKPLATHPQQIDQIRLLAQSTQRPIGIHLELVYLESLAWFKKRIGDQSIEFIQIDWQDPWLEQRGSIIKRAELLADVMHDQLPHCWSILRMLLPQQTIAIESVQLDHPVVTVNLSVDTVPAIIRLCRRGDRRTRSITINRGQHRLNFANEPGYYSNHLQKYVACPQLTHRPLDYSLGNFLEHSCVAIVHPDHNAADPWPLSLHNWWDGLSGFIQASQLLQQRLDHQIASRLKHFNGLDLQLAELIVDRRAAESLARQADRELPYSPEQQLDFARRWLSGTRGFDD